MKTSLAPASTEELLARLHEANAAFAHLHPGEPEGRQPVHTVYGGAHLFKAETASKLGGIALRSLAEYAPDAATLGEALGLPAGTSGAIYDRVTEKLRREPVEDYRIDFEDGYGVRSAGEEDAHAAAAALEVARGIREGGLPPFIGIRIKPLTSELSPRAIRTLDIFLSTLWDASGGALPPGFVVTLPKVTIPEQVRSLAELFDILESSLNIPRGTLKLELMIETAHAVIDPSGRVAIPVLLDAAEGRCIGIHFGAYDYTAECGITATYQGLSHPACDFARHAMQVSAARTGIWLADSATNVLPVPIHRAPEGGALSEGAIRENREAVHGAWRLHYDDVRRSLANGFYQGWDLHPAQLVSRYAALYAFFHEGLDVAAERLRTFIKKAAQATLADRVFDDAATGQGLLNYFLRAMSAGAITEAEAEARTGLSAADLRGRSFVQIVARQRG
jgi:citrate lyase beta subunit